MKKLAPSEVIRRAIAECGMTRYRICKLTGLSQAALCRFMKGSTCLNVATVDRLAGVLGLEIVVRKNKIRR